MSLCLPPPPSATHAPLVGVKVEGELGVPPFDDHARGPLDGCGPDAALEGGVEGGRKGEGCVWKGESRAMRGCANPTREHVNGVVRVCVLGTTMRANASAQHRAAIFVAPSKICALSGPKSRRRGNTGQHRTHNPGRGCTACMCVQPGMRWGWICFHRRARCGYANCARPQDKKTKTREREGGARETG